MISSQIFPTTSTLPHIIQRTLSWQTSRMSNLDIRGFFGGASKGAKVEIPDPKKSKKVAKPKDDKDEKKDGDEAPPSPSKAAAAASGSPKKRKAADAVAAGSGAAKTRSPGKSPARAAASSSAAAPAAPRLADADDDDEDDVVVGHAAKRPRTSVAAAASAAASSASAAVHVDGDDGSVSIADIKAKQAAAERQAKETAEAKKAAAAAAAAAAKPAAVPAPAPAKAAAAPQARKMEVADPTAFLNSAFGASFGGASKAKTSAAAPADASLVGNAAPAAAAAASSSRMPVDAGDDDVVDLSSSKPSSAASSAGSPVRPAAAAASAVAQRGTPGSAARGKRAAAVASPAPAPAPKAIVLGDEDDDDDDDVVMAGGSSARKAGKPAPSPAAKPPAASPAPAAAAAAGRKLPFGPGAVVPRPAPATSSSGGLGSGSGVASALGSGGYAEPRGAPGCLAGTVFVLTGELEHLTRDRAVGLIERLGGKCTSSVPSRNTTHLLHGPHLEDGRDVTLGSKYQGALRQNEERREGRVTAAKKDGGGKLPEIKIFTESEFEEFLDQTLPADQRKAAREPLPPIAGAAPATSSSSRPAGVGAGASSSSAVASSSSGGGRGDNHLGRAASSLWVDKYAPKHFSEYLGNQKELRSLDTWLRDWEGIHATGTIPKPKYSRENPGAKAALISGPPGIGKTTAATLLARAYGYDVLELNASDARSKKVLQESLGGVVGASSLAGFVQKGQPDGGHIAAAAASSSSSSGGGGVKRLIIMDEVDGMSSGDRGGNAELIKLIKLAKCPIIAICNDRQKPTVRSLANHCYDIKFHRPTREVIASRMGAIAQAEGLAMDTPALEALVESCGADIRQVLNTLQMWATTVAGAAAAGAHAAGSSSVSAQEMRARLSAINKDATLRLDAFSAAPRLFSDSKKENLDARMDLFFVDYDFTPLLVQQAYVDVAAKSGTAGASPAAALAKLAKAADALSEGDVYTDYIRSRQAWGLLPSLAVATVRTATLAGTVAPYMSFPTWLGKNSSRGKRARMLAEFALHIAPHVSGGREALRLDYTDPMRTSLFAPLLGPQAVADPAPAVDAVINMLDGYGLSRTDMMETLPEVAFPPPEGSGPPGAAAFPDYLKGIDSKVKAAFTREYNKRPHKAQTLGGVSAGAVASMKGGKRGGGGSGGGLGSEEGEEDDEPMMVADEDLGDLEADEDEGNGEDKPLTEKEIAAFRKKTTGRGSAAGKAKGAGAGSGAKAKPKAAAAAGKGAGASKAKPKAKKKAAVDDDDDEEEVEFVDDEDDDE